MADYQLQASRFHKEANFSSAGIIAPISGHKLYGETALSVEVENASSLNSVAVEGRLQGSSDWMEIEQIGGCACIESISIEGYDYIRFKVIRYGAIPECSPKLIASAFFHKTNGNEDVIVALNKNNELLEESICIQNKIYRKMELLLSHIEVMTDEEINGDL